jgi:hypothetical protein
VRGTAHGVRCAATLIGGRPIDAAETAAAGCSAVVEIGIRAADHADAATGADVIRAECRHRARPWVVDLVLRAHGPDAASVPAPPEDGEETPLHACSRAGCLECCALLVGAGADARAADASGAVPFHVASTAAVADYIYQVTERDAAPVS